MAVLSNDLRFETCSWVSGETKLIQLR